MTLNAPISANIFAIIGARSHIKSTALNYCFNFFDKEAIWLVDSLQIFDPYSLSRVNTERTRQMLFSIRVSRPFTFYQLKDKIFSFRKIKLTRDSTIIISSIDCFNDDIDNSAEKSSLFAAMLRLLTWIQDEKGCKIIIGLKDKETLSKLLDCWGYVTIWEEQFCLQDTRSRPSLMSFADS